MNTNEISDASLRQTPGPAGEPVEVADERSRHEFERLYHQTCRDKPNMPPGEYREAPKEEAKGGENRDESLTALMRSLYAERLGTPSAQTQAAPVVVDSADSADSAAPRAAERIERLVEQILVSLPDSVGDREVRLMVKNSVLPDTEIRLSRGTDGLLSVTLETGRHDTFQTLVAAQAELKRALDTQENREVRLVVVDTRDTGAEEGRSDQRSRCYTTFSGFDDDEAR